MLWIEGVEYEAKSLQQAGIVRIKHNPGLKKKKKKKKSGKLKLMKQGPFQPKINFPKNEEIQSESSKHQLQFFRNWYNEYPHLEYSFEKDLAYWFASLLFPTGPGHK